VTAASITALLLAKQVLLLPLATPKRSVWF